MIRFEVAGRREIRFTVDGAEEIGMAVGKAVVLRQEPEKYRGAYTVTPKTERQTLETAGKLLTDNVAVREIPYYDVSNTSGGSTVYIGREVI